MTLPLFREEALEHNRQQLLGDLVVYQPLSQRLLTIVAVVFTLTTSAFVILADYARKEAVEGLLTPSKGLAQIYARSPGTVTELYVKDGETVAQNQPLFLVLVEQSTSHGDAADSKVLQSIAEGKAEIESQIRIAGATTAGQRADLKGQLTGLKAELAQVENQRTFQSQLTELARADVDSGALLFKHKNLSAIEFRKRQQAFLSSGQQEAQLAERAETLRASIGQTQAKLDQLDLSEADQLSKLRGAARDLDRSAGEVEERRAYVVRAPVAGKITAMQAALGQTTDGKLPLMAILPAGGALQAEVFVPSRAIGFVKLGQEVKLLYDAFPHDRFGAQAGHVEAISRAILAASDVPAVVGAKEPVYRVDVRLDRQTIDIDGEALPLQAGEQLTAHIVVDRRRILDWLLAPLHKLREIS